MTVSGIICCAASALTVQKFTGRKVSASTHNQALSAVLFLYREVLDIKLPWMDDINRPANKRRIPSVMKSLACWPRWKAKPRCWRTCITAPACA